MRSPWQELCLLLRTDWEAAMSPDTRTGGLLTALLVLAAGISAGTLASAGDAAPVTDSPPADVSQSGTEFSRQVCRAFTRVARSAMPAVVWPGTVRMSR